MPAVKQGPVLKPGKIFDWSLVYDPAANDGNGEDAGHAGHWRP